MSTETIEQDLRAFVENELLKGRNDIDLDGSTNLFTSGAVDSMGIMRLIAHIENTHGVKVPPSDQTPGNFRTLDVISGYVAGLL